MIQSMTGYGKASGLYLEKKIVAEIKSLNSKQMDLSTRIMSCYKEKELEIRSLINRQLERGKVDFCLYIESTAQDNGAQINRDLLMAYKKQISEIAAQNNIPEPNDWFSTLLRMPDVLKAEQQELDEAEWQVVQDVVQSAINNLIAFRKQEGAALEQFFNNKINNIEALSLEVPKYERPRIDKIKSRLEDNLKSLDDKISFDPNRLEQELIFYIEKLDISEEKQRLANHLKYFRETLGDSTSVGKKLGFIAQEMGREINTLGSKANQSEMQILVVKMKDELEQIKEQVLNVL
ncbi:MAG: YicC family protein [Paludibacteraceae bacterium]|nr:YicC family protein [Paludibacteraceae bacterium]